MDVGEEWPVLVRQMGEWGLLHVVFLSDSDSRRCGLWDDKTDGGHLRLALVWW